MCARTSSIICNYRLRDSAGTRGRKSSPIVIAQKLVCKVDDPQAQRIHQENAGRMLLATFVSGLTGTPGKQCRFSNPQNIQQALSIALTVDQAEKQDRFMIVFTLGMIRQVTREITQ